MTQRDNKCLVLRSVPIWTLAEGAQRVSARRQQLEYDSNFSDRGFLALDVQ